MDTILGIILIFAAGVILLLLLLIPFALIAWLANVIVMLFGIFAPVSSEHEAK